MKRGGWFSQPESFFCVHTLIWQGLLIDSLSHSECDVRMVRYTIYSKTSITTLYFQYWFLLKYVCMSPLQQFLNNKFSLIITKLLAQETRCWSYHVSTETFQKLDLFLTSSGGGEERERETYSVGSLRKDWRDQSMSYNNSYISTWHQAELNWGN
jgi:hypothetical protein